MLRIQSKKSACSAWLRIFYICWLYFALTSMNTFNVWCSHNFRYCDNFLAVPFKAQCTAVVKTSISSSLHDWYLENREIAMKYQTFSWLQLEEKKIWLGSARFLMNKTFPCFSRTCFARRKVREIPIYQKFVQILVVLIFFHSSW